MNIKKRNIMISILLSMMLLWTSILTNASMFFVQAEEIIKIACVGDSLTDGYLSSGGNKSNTAYPARLAKMLGEGYEVGNYGKTSYTLMKGTDKSYWDSSEFQNSKSFLPDYVIIMLGTNDSKANYWNEEQYKADANELYQEYANLSSQPKVIFALSPQSYATTTNITHDSVAMLHEAQVELVQENGWDHIDMYEKTTNRQELFHSDMIHFTDIGYRYIAECMYEKITGQKLPEPLDPNRLINKDASSGISVVHTSTHYGTQVGANTLDYDHTTHWHSDWSGSDVLPQSITYNLNKLYCLTDFTFLPRQVGGYNGDILEMNIYIGESEDDLKQAGTYTFEAGTTGLEYRSEFKRITLDKVMNGQYVKVEVTKSAADTQADQNKWASLAEIRFYGQEVPEYIPPNKDALKAAIEEIKGILRDGTYTTHSVYNMHDSLNHAEDVYEYYFYQESIDAAVEDLYLKKSQLVDCSMVEEKLDEIYALLKQTDIYYYESLWALEDKRNEAIYFLNHDYPYTAEDVEAFVKSMQDAIDRLEKIVPLPAVVTNIKVVQNSYKEATLTWDAIEHASSYDVYRKSYKDSKFGFVKSVDKPTLKFKNLITGKPYQFYVIAKNKTGTSEKSDIVTISTQLEGVPTLAIEQLSKTKFTLSWNKIDGATRYIIYRKRNSDAWKKVLTLGINDFSYTTSELPKGEYSFIVKAGRYDSKDRVMTPSSNIVKATSTYPKPVITLTAQSNQIQVSWKAIEGVTHYRVYRATSEDGKYTLLKTTTLTSYTSKSLKSGKYYYYKIRGYKTYDNGKYKEKIFTAYSDVKSIKAK